MLKITFFLLLAALALPACGYSVSGAIDEVRSSDTSAFEDGKTVSSTATTTEAFTMVKALGPDNIIFVTGDAFTIKAAGNAKAVTTLRFILDDGTIKIGRAKGNWFGDEGQGVTITITAPKLTAASLAGSGDFTADKMEGDAVEVKIAGSGSLKVAQVTAKTLEAKIAGSGDAIIAGTAESAEFSVLGSGSINGQKLTATNAELSIAGSGDVSINATGKVEAKVAGSGDINVTGGATCASKSMGSGDINCS